METIILNDDFFYNYKKNNQYQIYASIEEEENIFEVAIWTDTIHFESDRIKYKYFKSIEECKKYILKQFNKFQKSTI